MSIIVAYTLGFGGGLVIGINASPLGIPLKIIQGLTSLVPKCASGSPGLLGKLEATLPPLAWLGEAERSNAQIIINVGLSQYHATQHDLQIAIATSLQETGLQNDNFGDRDSLGLFQQRPSQGWGTPAQILNPNYASGKFYSALMNVPGRASMSLMAAAEAVQRPDPAAYARTWAWDQKAAAIVADAVPVKPTPTPTSATPTSTPTSTPAPAETAPQAITTPTPSPTSTDGGNLFNCIGLSQLLPSSANKCEVGKDLGPADTYQGNAIRLCDVRNVEVNATIAKQIDAMVAAATKDGVTLVGSGFRSYKDQISLRQKNHCANLYTAAPSTCSPPTALPGTSMHEQGLAVDWQMTAGVFSWLQQHASTYGFKNLPSEPWHWSTTGH
jgi:hypothetical protein